MKCPIVAELTIKTGPKKGKKFQITAEEALDNHYMTNAAMWEEDFNDLFPGGEDSVEMARQNKTMRDNIVSGLLGEAAKALNLSWREVEVPDEIDGERVVYGKTGIYVGCQHFSVATVEKMLKKCKDFKK